MSASVVVAVSHCAGCPFVLATEDRAEPWMCDAMGSEDGTTDPRTLPEQRIEGPRWPDPPDWCPLRGADRLVQLRVS